MKFEDMNLEKCVLDSLCSMGFKEPTKIQIETIPLIKQGHDVIGQSETGSGKTAAFGIPLVEKIEKGKHLQALVLAPTRELALQIAGEFQKFSKLKGLYIQTVYGGVGMEPQIEGLKKAEIVVGTPGRVLDHMCRGTMDTSKVKIFVLDEADKMIDMGFVEDIEEIESGIPPERQTLLFSATMPESLCHIRDKFTKNPKKIKTSTKVKDDFLKQHYVDVEQNMKFSLLVHLIEKENPALAIIFSNSRGEASSVARNLRDNGINATELHGGLTQARREAVMEDFHKGKTKILVATDVAARGLDIKNVTHIFNYNIPKNAEDYTNRIGRTARAGASGKAISLLSRDDHDSFRRIIRTFDFDIEKKDVGEYRSLPFKRHFYGRDSEVGSGFGRGSRFGGGRSFGRGFGGHRSSGRGRSYGRGRSSGGSFYQSE
jgi:superfamily II DNA/RNA helicase